MTLTNDLAPQPGQLRVLHVEDNELDAELAAQALRRGGFSVSVVVVQAEAEFERQLRTHRPDIVLADYNLPQWKGMDALEVLRREGLDIPLILVSGALGDVTAVECIKRGATDYGSGRNFSFSHPAEASEGPSDGAGSTFPKPRRARTRTPDCATFTSMRRKAPALGFG